MSNRIKGKKTRKLKFYLSFTRCKSWNYSINDLKQYIYLIVLTIDNIALCSHGITCIDGSRSFVHINCSLVIPINRQMQSDGDSDVYFDVELILSK